MIWHNMDTAPRDGQAILAAYNNDLTWEYAIVWYSSWDPDYPWCSNDNDGYPEGRLDYWTYLTPPYHIEHE